MDLPAGFRLVRERGTSDSEEESSVRSEKSERDMKGKGICLFQGVCARKGRYAVGGESGKRVMVMRRLGESHSDALARSTYCVC